VNENERDYEELRGERDGAELARVASALDVSRERGPRPEFLARLRGDIERARHERAPARARPSLRGAAWTALAAVLAVIFAAAFPMQTNALDRGILVASGSGFVAYDPSTLQERARVSVPASQPWAMLAPDNETLVFTFVQYTRAMRILDIHKPGAFRQVAGLQSPYQFALSKNGSKAYVRDVDAIKIVDVTKASVIGTIPTPGVEDSPVYMAPDDRRLFQFTPSGELIVFDVEDGKETRRVKVELKDTPGLSASARLVFSPDGSRVYAVGSEGSAGGPVGVLVLDTGTLDVVARASLDADSGPSLSREHDPLADLDAAIASLGFVADAKEFGTVTQIALSPDGRTLYAARGAAGTGILLIDTQRLAVIGRLQAKRSVYALQLTPDGGRVFALASPSGLLGSAQLLAVDSRSYGLVATASIRGAAADDAALLYKP
jgi:DNA-binding beta-propeller fold protein YncE